jgi:hypothetical protein
VVVAAGTGICPRGSLRLRPSARRCDAPACPVLDLRVVTERKWALERAASPVSGTFGQGTLTLLAVTVTFTADPLGQCLRIGGRDSLASAALDRHLRDRARGPSVPRVGDPRALRADPIGGPMRNGGGARLIMVRQVPATAARESNL